MASSGSTFSVIGADVSITGDIEAHADLHVDGTVTGDIVCAALVQGPASCIEGAIRAETARLSGTVRGTITARELIILKNARIEGDVHYEALTIEHGANVQGHLAPDARGMPAHNAPAEDDEAGPDGEPRLSLAS